MDNVVRPVRILIVDDDPMAHEMLSAIFYREGYALFSVGGGKEALACLSDIGPDLILLDVMMPQMDGFAVCQQIKAIDGFRHIPIILITALDDTADLVRGLDAGADDFISKPLNGLELRARLRSLLRSKRQYDELQRAIYMRDMLSSMIVHDIRNPLTAVLLYVQLLQKKGELSAEQSRYVDMIFHETQQVSAQLEDISLLTKLESGRYTLAYGPLDIIQLFSELTPKLTAHITANHLDLVITSPSPPTPEVLADVTLFPRLIENLMTQTVKAAPPHSTVRFQIDYPKHSNRLPTAAQLRLQFSHEGLHIPSDDLLRMFDKFETVKMHHANKSHAGLSLAYCKAVIDAHGGFLSVANITPRGVMYTLELT